MILSKIYHSQLCSANLTIQLLPRKNIFYILNTKSLIYRQKKFQNLQIFYVTVLPIKAMYEWLGMNKISMLSFWKLIVLIVIACDIMLQKKWNKSFFKSKNFFKLEKQRYLSHYWSGKPFNGTFGNQALIEGQLKP